MVCQNSSHRLVEGFIATKWSVAIPVKKIESVRKLVTIVCHNFFDENIEVARFVRKNFDKHFSVAMSIAIDFDRVSIRQKIYHKL